MRYTALSVVVLIGIGLVSCSDTEQAKPSARMTFGDLARGGTVAYSPNMVNQPNGQGNLAMNQPSIAPGSPMDLSGMRVNNAVQAEKPPVEPVIQIPADARWTLYCMSLAGPDRFARMAQLKAFVLANTGMKDWYVIHNEQNSTLFYGFYSTVERREPASARAHADQRRIQEWETDLKEKPFARCFFTPIVEPDPVAPAEWKLTNASKKALWSLEIGAFKDNPLRKQAAVEAVKELRAKGVEAYFYHGESISSVCVGAWPMEAVENQDDFSGRTIDSEDDVLVSPDPLPERLQKAKITGKDGHRIRAYSRQIEVKDPSLKAAMAEYPYHPVNYDVYSAKMQTTKGTKEKIPSPSFLVKIPGAEDRLLNGGGTAEDTSTPGLLNQVGAPLPPPPGEAMHQPGTGRLRGLGN